MMKCLCFSILFLRTFINTQDITQLTINCFSNCIGNSSTEKKTSFSVRCKPKCGTNSFQWSIEPEPDDFVRERDTSIKMKGKYFYINAWVVSPGTYNITVSVSGQIQSVSKQLIFTEVGQSFKIECTPNCNSADPDFDVKLIVNATKEGYKPTYIWSFSPPSSIQENIIFESMNKTIIILGGSYENSGKVVVVLRNKAKKKTTAINFILKRPIIQIQCRENCDEFNSLRKTILYVTCNGNCPNKITYQWRIQPSANRTYSEGSERNQFIIPAETFHGGEEAIVTAVLGKSLTSFKIKYKGSCEIDPQEGYAGETNFYVHCNYVNTPIIDVIEKIPQYPDLPGLVLYHGLNNNQSFLFSQGKPANISVVVYTYSDLFNFPIRVETSPDKLQESEIIKGILFSTGNSLHYYKDDKNYEKVIQLSAALMDTLQETPEEIKNHYMHHILDDIHDISPHVDPLQMLSLLVKVSTKENAVTSKDILSNLIKTVSMKIGEDDMKFSEQALTVISREIVIVVSSLVERIPNTTSSQFGNFDTNIVNFNDHMRHITYNALKSIEILGHLRDDQKNPIDLVISDNLITATVPLKPFQQIKIQPAGAKSSIKIESRATVFFQNPIVVHFAAFQENPLWWHENAGTVSSEVVMVNMLEGDRKIENLVLPIDVYLKQHDVEPSFFNGSLSAEPKDVVHVHRFECKNGFLLTIVFYVSDEPYTILIATDYPLYEDVRSHGKPVRKGLLNTFKLAAESDVIYIGIARQRGTSVHYAGEVTAVTCLAWHGETWDWDTEGCQIDPDSDLNLTHCRCKRLSLFASSFIVAPNRIDQFSRISFSQAIERSSLVLGAVGIILLIWAMLMIWAARTDKKLNRTGFKILEDNVPGDKFTYFIEVITGPWQNAGTSAKVAIQLVGNGTHSRVHLLNGPGLLNQGDQHVYIMYSPMYLGNLLSIRLFHDSHGSRPHWYCERVTIHYLAKREKYDFIVQKWFSLIYSDGRIVRQILVADKQRALDPKVLFTQNAKDEFKDSNLWFSVILRDAHSNFSSKERVTVGASVLLLSMVTSAMFYGVINVHDLDKGAFELTVSELSIVFQSLLITVPVGVLITILFRKSRPRWIE